MMILTQKRHHPEPASDAWDHLSGPLWPARLDYLEARFLLDNDVSLLPSLIDRLEREIDRLELCDPRTLGQLRGALHEALTNAILHGNLGLGSALGESDEEEFFRLAVARASQKPYCDRRVHVTARFTHEELTFVIRDEGQGFDPEALPDPTAPENLGQACGRGLLLIRAFMDRVAHNDRGNEITLVKRLR
jgi:anti-sigma regulatory factor (Ser/Thr protein kinase)